MKYQKLQIKNYLFVATAFIIFVGCVHEPKTNCVVVNRPYYVGENSVLLGESNVNSCTGLVEEEFSYRPNKKPSNITLFLDNEKSSDKRNFYHLFCNEKGELIYIEKFRKDSLIKLMVFNDSIFEIMNHPHQ